MQDIWGKLETAFASSTKGFTAPTIPCSPGIWDRGSGLESGTVGRVRERESKGARE